jgi:hypothetical protein
MSKKLTELQAGALNAWTPTQQAALYHHHLASQVAADEAKLDEEERKKKKDEGKEDNAKGKPEEVRTGEVLDGLVSCVLGRDEVTDRLGVRVALRLEVESWVRADR